MITRRGMVAGLGAAAGGAALFAHSCSRIGRYDAAAAGLRVPIAPGAPWSPLELCRYATLAANSHNSQPWRIAITADRAILRPDWRYRLPAVDPDDHHIWVSLGCAAENLAVAAEAMGRTAQIGFDTGAQAVVARFAPARTRAHPWRTAVVARQSTRLDYSPRVPPAAVLDGIVRAAQIEGVELDVLTDPVARAPLRELVLAANRAQMQTPAFVDELRDWIRFSDLEALARGDGLASRVTGAPSMPRWLGERLFSLGYTIDGETRKIAGWMGNAAGLAFFAGKTDDPAGWVAAGRSFQRFALALTAAGLRHAHVNMPVEVAATRAQLAAHLRLGARRPDLLIRFGYGPMAPWSLRRPPDRAFVPV